MLRRLLAVASFAGCAVAQTTFRTTLPCFDDNNLPEPCTFALQVDESNLNAGFALGGGGGFGTTFGAGTFGGVVDDVEEVTTTKEADVGSGLSGDGEDQGCLSLIPFENPAAQFACAQFIFNNNNAFCCTCVDPRSVEVGEMTVWEAESNCTVEQVNLDIKENVEFVSNVSGTTGQCLNQCCETGDSPTALVFEVTINTPANGDEVKKVCTEQKNEECKCAPSSFDVPEEPACEDNTTVTVLIVVFSVIGFIVLALAVYFVIKRDEEDKVA